MVPSLAPGSQHERRRIESAPTPAPTQEAGHTALLRACLWVAPLPGRCARDLDLGTGTRGRARAGGGTLPGRAGRPSGAAHGQGEP
eukprot:5830443-Prymnesium_polylepis.1